MRIWKKIIAWSATTSFLIHHIALIRFLTHLQKCKKFHIFCYSFYIFVHSYCKKCKKNDKECSSFYKNAQTKRASAKKLLNLFVFNIFILRIKIIYINRWIIFNITLFLKLLKSLTALRSADANFFTTFSHIKKKSKSFFIWTKITI